MSLLQQDPFGARVVFVGLENFKAILEDPYYLAALWRTAYFSVAVTLLAMIPALLLAVMADRVARWAAFYKTTLVVPYAIAPAVAGVLWLFMFNPAVGTIAWVMKSAGVDWNPTLNGTQAMWLVIVASAWKQIAYNFLFFLAGLQSIPRSLLEAASIDGASEARKFWSVVFPLLSPTTFFLLVVNLVYAFFDTFGVVHAVTGGGPAKATEILVYKVYYDGVHALDLGSSSAQSVILMAIVVALTVVQFRFIERKVHY
jgi:sn-glycerol 3-phosphate transport system permease protein